MKKILMVAVMLIVANSAKADIYLEPYIGYQVGTSKGSVTFAPATTNAIDEKDSGMGFGAKVGYSMLLFAAGLDYMSTSLTGKDQSTPPAADNHWKGTDLGLFAQISLPILLKFSATYFVSSKLKDDSELTGGGFKVGVGFTVLPLLSINLDMINLKYKDATVPGQTVTSLDANLKTFMVGLSMPLSF